MLECSREGAMMDTLYTVEEVAALLKVTPLTVRRWLTSGQLPGVKLERFWRVTETDLQAFLDQRRRHGG